jgi:hypothetical protein
MIDKHRHPGTPRGLHGPDPAGCVGRRGHSGTQIHGIGAGCEPAEPCCACPNGPSPVQAPVGERLCTTAAARTTAPPAPARTTAPPAPPPHPPTPPRPRTTTAAPALPPTPPCSTHAQVKLPPSTQTKINKTDTGSQRELDLSIADASPLLAAAIMPSSGPRGWINHCPPGTSRRATVHDRILLANSEPWTPTRSSAVIMHRCPQSGPREASNRA